MEGCVGAGIVVEDRTRGKAVGADHGVPVGLDGIADRGADFTAKMWREL